MKNTNTITAQEFNSSISFSRLIQLSKNKISLLSFTNGPQATYVTGSEEEIKQIISEVQFKSKQSLNLLRSY